MATRLYFFIEFDRTDSPTPFSYKGSVFCLNMAEFIINPDYDFFDILAGARRRSLNLPPNEEILIVPRGFPYPCSDAVFHRFFHRIESDIGDVRRDIPSTWTIPLWTVSDVTARRWIEDGFSFLSPQYGRFHEQAVSDPDWHSVSWLSNRELLQCIGYHQSRGGTVDVALDAIVSASTRLAARLGDERVRCVFWFSN